jgi:hypothetical protein
MLRIQSPPAWPKIIFKNFEVADSDKHTSLVSNDINSRDEKFCITDPTRGQCYETFYGRKLRIFILS